MPRESRQVTIASCVSCLPSRADTRLVILGGSSQAGSYVLRIRIERACDLAFGRFMQGRIVRMPAGDYVYIGSALAHRGPSSLARRLVRHATRSGELPPHPIRDTMVRCFPSIGLGPSDPLPRRDKRLHWNVDHMLDLEHADLVQVFVLRYPERIERRLGEFLEAQSVTTILAPGIGAHDVKGATHLFRVDAPAAWWDALPDELLCLCAGTA